MSPDRLDDIDDFSPPSRRDRCAPPPACALEVASRLTGVISCPSSSRTRTGAASAPAAQRVTCGDRNERVDVRGKRNLLCRLLEKFLLLLLTPTRVPEFLWPPAHAAVTDDVCPQTGKRHSMTPVRQAGREGAGWRAGWRASGQKRRFAPGFEL